MLDKEKLLKEQRVATATDKNYIGLDGKFGVILKYLGKPIISQGSANYDVTEWKDVYDIEDQQGLPEEDIDAPIREIGKVFEGLKYGYNLEISYLKDGTIPIKVDQYHTAYTPAAKVLKVSWHGYLVYLEAEGDLHIFTPNSEWEDVVLKVYDAATKLQKQYRMDNIEETQIASKEAKLNFLERLRERWGI